MLNCYDFEVFKNNWLVVIINITEQTETVIIDDAEKLQSYYELHKNEIWIGYNSRHYDQYIFKGILLGMNPKAINDFIIVEDKPGWQYSSAFKTIPLYNYDVAKLNDGGLKTLESYMGNDIQETSVPFDIDRPLTADEIAETVKYCRHDVEQTAEVFLERINDFNAHMDLIKMYDLPLSYVSKTQSQLSAAILNCTQRTRDDEFDIEIVDTLQLTKYRSVLTWYLSEVKKHEYGKPLKIDIAGVPHVFGWGGAHGARAKYHGKGLILHVDVNSYYPSLMLRYGFLTRNSATPERYRKIYDTRLALKHAGKKKEQAPLKIVLNGTFGISKDKTNPAFDPKQANNICINGQLLLIDLIEKLEAVKGFELIQSNTDGLIIKIPDTDEAFEHTDDVCYEWETRTGMGLGLDVITEIWQGDVNNYVFRFDNGKLERKGAYVKELDRLSYDLAIVNTAMVKYMTEGIPVEKTIRECNDLNQFQKVVKLSSKYKYVWHNGKRFSEKCFRVFASKNTADGYIGKQKADGATIEKFANTPEHCFIDNAAINDKEPPKQLNKQWYIDLAKKRMKEKFGEILP